MKILAFGNEFIKQDSLAKEIADELGLDVVKCASPDEMMDFKSKEKIVILDVVQNLKEPRVIDIGEIKNQAKTAHDLDLGFFLRLKKEMKEISDVRIIGIPQKGNKELIKKKVLALIPDNL